MDHLLNTHEHQNKFENQIMHRYETTHLTIILNLLLHPLLLLRRRRRHSNMMKIKIWM